MTTPRAVARPAAAASSIPQLIFGDLWEYDPAPETADPKLKSRYDLFIGGKFVAPKSGKYFESINPATEEVLAEIALADCRGSSRPIRTCLRYRRRLEDLTYTTRCILRRPTTMIRFRGMKS